MSNKKSLNSHEILYLTFGVILEVELKQPVRVTKMARCILLSHTPQLCEGVWFSKMALPNHTLQLCKGYGLVKWQRSIFTILKVIAQ